MGSSAAASSTPTRHPPTMTPRRKRRKGGRRSAAVVESSSSSSPSSSSTTVAATVSRRTKFDRRGTPQGKPLVVPLAAAVALVLAASYVVGFGTGPTPRRALLPPVAFRGQRNGRRTSGGSPFFEGLSFAPSSSRKDRKPLPLFESTAVQELSSAAEAVSIESGGDLETGAVNGNANGVSVTVAAEAELEANGKQVTAQANGKQVAESSSPDGAGAVLNGASASADVGKNGAVVEETSTVAAAAAAANGTPEVPVRTAAGGYSHTEASKAKISAANKGKVPWNKGKGRSEEVKARIAAGVRKRNRERFLAKLKDMGMTEEEYEANKKAERRRKDAERRARRTENGGYRPTEETKAKISAILKEKWAKGEVKKRKPSGGARRKGFKHSEETKQKIRESLRKRWATDPDYRARKVSSARQQNSSEDARKRIAETLRKKWEDPEFRAYMMEKMANRKKPNVVVDDEHRAKISRAMKAKWQDAAYRAKAVEGMRKHMEANPRPRKPPSSGTRRRKSTKKARQDGVQLGDGLVALSSVVPRKRAPPRSRKSTKTTGVNGAASGTAVKRKKRKKAAKKRVTASNDDASVGVMSAVDPLTSPASPPPLEEEEEPIDMSDGSVDRLRLERRDLYDLLYGDEETESETNFATESAFYDKEKLLDTQAKAEKAEPRATTAEGGESSKTPSLASTFAFMKEDDMDDENLDNFDPYGLDDF